MIAFVVIGAVVIWIIVFACVFSSLGSLNKDVDAVWAWSKRHDDQLNRLERQTGTLSDGYSSIYEDNARIKRLQNEQLTMKLEAMDACKAMLRDTMNYDRRS